jgi:hypothetical protein
MSSLNINMMSTLIQTEFSTKTILKGNYTFPATVNHVISVSPFMPTRTVLVYSSQVFKYLFILFLLQQQLLFLHMT